ncbi:hypothetical protein K8R30_01280 [archaeon]|nr:hypothetical protein [archaeon]
MKVKLRTESYMVEGIDESGLIPDGTEHVLVFYGPNGNLNDVSLGTSFKHTKKGELFVDERDLVEHRRLNSNKKHKEKIVGLLKKLSSN